MANSTERIQNPATESHLAGGKGVRVQCRYDRFRARLLDGLRAMKGPEYEENESMIVQDALDELLKREGLLPSDAVLYSQVPARYPGLARAAKRKEE